MRFKFKKKAQPSDKKLEFKSFEKSKQIPFSNLVDNPGPITINWSNAVMFYFVVF